MSKIGSSKRIKWNAVTLPTSSPFPKNKFLRSTLTRWAFSWLESLVGVKICNKILLQKFYIQRVQSSNFSLQDRRGFMMELLLLYIEPNFFQLMQVCNLNFFFWMYQIFYPENVNLDNPYPPAPKPTLVETKPKRVTEDDIRNEVHYVSQFTHHVTSQILRMSLTHCKA